MKHALYKCIIFIIMFLYKIKSFLTKYMVMDNNAVDHNRKINTQLINNHLNKIDKNDYSILDAGCGLGENLDEIFKQNINAKIIGMDIHLPDLKKAKKMMGDKVTFIHCDCLNMKLDDNSIDIVLSNQVLEHIKEYDQYLSEIARVLKKGGLFVISTPNFLHPRNVFLKLLFQKPQMRWENSRNLPPEKYRGHTQEFYEEELISILKKHNFNLIEEKSIKPSLTLSGNIPFIIYRFFEYLFFILTKIFIRSGYNKNHNFILQYK